MPKECFSVKVTTTATKILAANPLRVSYTLQNIPKNTDDVALGANADVTTDQGEILPLGLQVSDDIDKEDVYAIAFSGTQDLRVSDVLKVAP